MISELFASFDFSRLNDPRFKEDSVREVLIAPLIKDFGYFDSGNTQIVRSHRLKHPFVSIGSTRKNVTLIPDYLLQVSERPAWILEAKSPSEDILDTKHIEQAYSYAIHPEIRVNYFALCNGHYFSLYNVSREKPLFYISLRSIELYRKMLKDLLSPLKVFSYPDAKLSKDFGLHIKRLGFKSSDSIIIVNCKPLMIIKYNEDLFSISAPVGNETTSYLGTFDFNSQVAKQLEPVLGKHALDQLMRKTTGTQQFNLDREIRLTLDISLPEADYLVENDDEIYLPLKINKFIVVD